MPAPSMRRLRGGASHNNSYPKYGPGVVIVEVSRAVNFASRVGNAHNYAFDGKIVSIESTDEIEDEASWNAVMTGKWKAEENKMGSSRGWITVVDPGNEKTRSLMQGKVANFQDAAFETLGLDSVLKTVQASDAEANAGKAEADCTYEAEDAFWAENNPFADRGGNKSAMDGRLIRVTTYLGTKSGGAPILKTSFSAVDAELETLIKTAFNSSNPADRDALDRPLMAQRSREAKAAAAGPGVAATT